jgi:lysophospholipase L1-like esterase
MSLLKRPRLLQLVVVISFAAIAVSISTSSLAQPQRGRGAARPEFIPADYNDREHMMQQLGIEAMRPGKSGNNQTGKGFDEATANEWLSTLPDVLTMSDGAKVTTPEQWTKRRAEIVEDFEREVYGRIPANVPKVTWEVTSTTEGAGGDIPTVTKTLVGHVDNSAFPQITVNIQASFTVPADSTRPVPMLIEFGGGFGFGGRGRRDGTAPRRGNAAGGGAPPWTQQAISHGWGYGYLNPGSIQADGGNQAQLRQGIIGLANKGQPRKPDDWGALRAWQWGLSRLIDYFEANPDAKVDPKKVGIEGVSRYGKAALVAGAFDERVAVAFVASSGAGGAKLHRRDFGEAVENLTGGEYYWFAGNFMKYGASDAAFGAKNASDIPVDAHQLIALCAPRPCFISYGVENPDGGGIADPKWVDAHGSFMATVLAGPVYKLLGKKDLDVTGDYLTEPMPPVNQLIGGELAWRQHSGGHTSVPNFPAFFAWVKSYVPSEPPSAKAASPENAASDRKGEPTVRALPRTDANSKLAHEQLLAKAKQGRIDVYFVGDSITRRWGASDYPQYLANWRQNFTGWNAANFGWGADRVENILWRLENGELDGVNPKIIVIQAGTNNIAGPPGDDSRVDQITRGLAQIIQVCRSKAPSAVIILTAIFPRNDNPNASATITKVNESLARLADSKQIRYLNINDKLADAEGRLLPGMMNADRLHPDTAAYQLWADALKPIFTERLGPPAQQDHAPPPTGDPSAARR